MTEIPKPSRVGRLVNSMIAPFAPGLALGREVNAAKRQVLIANMSSHYDGAGRSGRGADFRANRSDAVEAIRADRDRLSWIGRDMLRNNPRVVKARRQLVGNVVAGGIKPSVRWVGAGDDDGKKKALVEKLIRKHCLTTAFDADGLRTMFGHQGQGFGSVVVDGEILFRRRYRSTKDGFPLNFQVQMLEADFLDKNVDGDLPNGNYAVQGIEFDRIGRRVAYHLYKSHPGGRGMGFPGTVRIDAAHIIHAFDPVRSGQHRGISWLAPVITLLHELHKYQDAQVKRQEIAAMFAGVFTNERDSAAIDEAIGTLTPGGILSLGQDESLEFTTPPGVDGYEAFMKATDRTIAAALGLTYEGFTGDYSTTNYTSGRMGRMDVDPQIQNWQQNIMVAQVCDGFGRWIAEAIDDVAAIAPADWELNWTPPVRPVVDPTKDFKAAETALRNGLKSKRGQIREFGGDPDAVEREIEEERAWANERDLVFASDAGASATATSDTAPADDADDDKKNGGRT